MQSPPPTAPAPLNAPAASAQLEQSAAAAPMSPEEESSVSPPAGLVAGKGSREAADERRMSSPPTGSKFDDCDRNTKEEDNMWTPRANTKEEENTWTPRANTKDEDNSWNTSDVEKFDGKIVYNPDGSAYIIEDSEMSEDDAVEIPQLIRDGCIVDGPGVSLSQFQVFPQIANAFYVSRNNVYNTLYGGGTSSPYSMHDKKIVPEVPIMHSYRVYTVRDNKTGAEGGKLGNIDEDKPKDCSSVPVKPILMCFICKLSFGYAKSFVAHAMGDHNVVLQDDERDILGHKNCSAIIQCVGKQKEPLVSFLEPLSPPVVGLKTSSSPARASPAVEESGNTATATSQQRSCSPQQQQQQQQQSTVQNQHVPETSVSLPEQSGSSSNNDSNNVSSRMSINNCVMDLTQKSPAAGSQGGRSSVSPSPGASPSPGTTLSPLLGGGMPYPQPPPNFLTGTTIGVCPDHMSGRPSGVECPKCELILSSSRLGGVGGPLAGMHSRNSCKTLKCPKCNWHYKYQETLEIHMKEKHPETETSCIYCIAGQPHPRLARGETYTCGYKPYRCEVCNYSTTTKGNLSIHMQSDKHLNNMQELQNGGVSNTDQLQQHQQSPSPQSQQHHKPGGLASPGPGHHHPHHSSPLAAQSQKPKPTFRCDVCNYETNVARNLRIHMTSEKHTHNMMVLQQNVKHMQTLNAIQQSHQQQMGFESLLFHPGMTLPGDKPPPHTEAALADMAYNQALLIQMMTGGQLPPHIPPELAPHMDMGLNPETMEPPPEPADPDPDHLFQCCVCNVFASDNLEALSHHLAADRTKIREQEILAVVAGHYVCKLCTYKTNLKANFQLHCKTDKHLQRLQHVNHVKEGGPRNEWKLKYVSSPGGVQVRCHACDYYTNSAHKLQLHTAGQRHEASALLFRHLREQDRSSTSPRIYHCALCGFSSRNKLPLLQHVRSMKHLQMEQIHQLQRRTEGKDVQTDIGEVFQILTPPPDAVEPESTENCDLTRDTDSKPDLKELSSPTNQCSTSDSLPRTSHDSPDSESPKSLAKESSSTSSSSSSHMCPYCNYTSSSEMRIQAHVLAQHSQERPRSSPSPVKDTFLCPLCQDGFKDKPQLERHVMQIHSVNSEGLQRLLLLVDQSHWLNTVSRPNTNLSPSSSSGGKDQEQKQNTSDSSLKMDEDKDDIQNLSSSEEQPDDENRCQTCSKLFRNIDELCAHQNETGHLELKQTPSGPGYLCWKKGCNQYFQSAHSLQMHFREIHSRGGAGAANMAVSEKHVYKYRCNQCSLAFKTMEKLQMHSQYHLIRDATKCVLCGRNFRSMISLNKHVEMFHADMNEEEMMAYKQSLMNNPLLLAGLSGQILDPSFNELLKKETMKADDDVMEVDDSPGKDAQDDGSAPAGDGENSDDSIVYREQQFLEDYLNSQAIAEDSYNDPNRKYKCHRCKVAFTRQSYLTSHNKTLLHRKGEKLSYPMEKYLDPNRPYKCDVCKESFTQKNILLVHYNSVSHLHKLKRAMQEQQQNNNNNTPVSPQTAASVAAAAALVAGLGVAPSSAATLNSKLMSSSSTEEDDKKPYKCNICKVAYSQGSTLDIHMRSVLHQTRASKIQDLALSGQIDLSKPLIEQPEPQKVQDQHKKSIQDILGSPKHLTSSTGSSISTQVQSLSQGSSPGTPITSGTQNLSTVPTSLVMSSAASSTTSTTSVIPSPTQHGNVISCQRCSALFMTQEQLTTHQQLYCLFGSPMSLFPPMPSSAASSQNTMTQSLASPHTSNNQSPSPIPLTSDDAFSRMAMPTKKSSQMYKHLLESFGFDLVMQFNENHQRRQRKEREENEKLMSEITSTTTIEEQQPIPIPMEEVPVEPEPVEMKMEEEPIEADLPEVSKSTCQHCNKEFSSVWVLKAHCEEVHRDLVPLDFLEKYAQKFKNEYEKKSVPTTTASSTTSTVSTSTSTTTTVGTTSISSTTSTTTSSSATSISTEMTPEKEVEDSKEAIQAKLGIQQQETTKVSATVSTPPQQQQQQQPQSTPATPTEHMTRASTPTASSTPGSSTDTIPASMNNPLSAGVSGNSSNPNIPMSLAQQMNEMQAALNVMAASQLQQQLQFNPMMMGMAGLGMGLPLGLNMPAIAAMNLQPPLVPMMMPPPPFDPMVGLGQGQNPLFQQQQSPMDTASLLAKQQQHLMQQQQAVNASQQKRARTRITDDQLKILRAHFDINNSPSEEQIHDMAGQSGLPPKVIKHWFRNTLFKERQRNKDSPYNFNNPPSTTLNLEEYEKTGEAKVMPLNTSCDDLQSPSSTPNTKEPPTSSTPVSATVTQAVKKPPPPQSPQSTISSQIQQSPQSSPTPQKQSQLLNMTSTPSSSTSQSSMQMNMSQSMPFPHPPEQIKTEPREMTPQSHLVESQEKFNSLMLETESRLKREIMDEKPNLYQHSQLHSPPSPSLSDRMNTIPSRNTSPENLTLSSIISSQLGPDGMPGNSGLNIPSSHSNMLPPKLTATSFATPPTQVATSSAAGLCLTPTSRSISPGRSNSSDCFTHALLAGAGGNSNGSNSSGGSSGKRANRTRFTDYQIKVLQEFFENNAYPKDDDLEYLSKLLSLSPRVIVVWFQNARQKARKVYENQPPVEPAPGIDETGANRFQRTPGLNYQCKKCLLVFQRYYELIRHQKTHCFKEEDAKRSAQAQAAAAQIAAVLSSEDSNSSTIIEQNQQSSMAGVTPTSNPSTPAAPVTPTPSQSMYPPSPVPPSTPTPDPKENSFQCDNCNLVFPRFDLWREHQLVHIMNPNLFPSYPPDSPFGILQQHAQMQQQAQQQQQQQQQAQQQAQQQQGMNMGLSDLSMSPQTAQQHPLISMLTANKRKFEEFEEMCEREGEQPKDKRLRTTILPEQLDYLYQKYQVESNPSRKMLENIAREVGLKKRVVQVWFQNTRARERKGQFRAHSQVINKRCPFCPALFKVKSALESHLATKHGDHCGRGEINIDSLPDEDVSSESTPTYASSQGGDSKTSSAMEANRQNMNIMPPIFPPFNSEMENSLKKYYEESMKRYISGLQTQHATQNGAKEGGADLRVKGEGNQQAGEGGTGGDSPLDLSRPMKLTLDQEVRSYLADPGPLTDLSERSLCDDDNLSLSLSISWSESMDNLDGDESNPTSPASSPQQRPSAHKRYRTQMSSLQVKVMKSLFNDYKTPTMTECEMLGKEIGLPKRVVQVWFQNARAKEKKTKLALQKVLGGGENDTQRLPEECKLCQFKYSHKYSVQDHIFTKSHIEVVKAYLESRMSKADLSGNASDGEFTIPSVPGGASDVVNNNNNNNTSQQQQLAQLQILQQMASLNLPAHAMAAMAAAKLDPKEQHPSTDEMALLHQLYGLGLSFPQSFMHPGMLSSTGF